MVNEIYIDREIYIHRSVGHKEKLPGNGQLTAPCKSKQANSLWFCVGVKSKYVFSEQRTTCEEERGLWGPCDVPAKKKNPTKPDTTRERKEGENVHALPQGNVMMMLGSQLRASE